MLIVDNETKTCRTFNFPFVSDVNELNFIESEDSETLFNGDSSKYSWYKVIISNCVWKIHDSLLVY